MSPLAKRQRLRALMARHKLTCRQIADLACVQPQTVRAWRAGQRNMTAGTLKLIELALQ